MVTPAKATTLYVNETESKSEMTKATIDNNTDTGRIANADQNQPKETRKKVAAAFFIAIGILVASCAAIAGSPINCIILVAVGVTIIAIALFKMWKKEPIQLSNTPLPINISNDTLPIFTNGKSSVLVLTEPSPSIKPMNPKFQPIQTKESLIVRDYTGDLSEAEKKNLKANFSNDNTLEISFVDRPSAITIRLQDMFESGAEVIVNAANTHLSGGGGIDGAIHDEGGKEYAAEHGDLAKMYQREYIQGYATMITSGQLKSKKIDHVIVVAGPSVSFGGSPPTKEMKNELYSCYYNSLELANSQKKTSIAFPAISTGIFGFPKDIAAAISLKAWYDFITKHPDTTLKSISIHFQGARSSLEMYEKILKAN